MQNTDTDRGIHAYDAFILSLCQCVFRELGDVYASRAVPLKIVGGSRESMIQKTTKRTLHGHLKTVVSFEELLWETV